MHKLTENIWELSNEARFYKCDQIAFPIGKDKDSFNISTHLQIDTETNELKNIQCQAVKNWMRSDDKRDVLFTGTYKKCYNAIISYIKENHPEELMLTK